eukprot:91572-Rhodomonas_salina.1
MATRMAGSAWKSRIRSARCRTSVSPSIRTAPIECRSSPRNTPSKTARWCPNTTTLCVCVELFRRCRSLHGERLVL